MKLSDIYPSKGTYVAARVLDPVPKLIYEHMIKNNVELSRSYIMDKLHTTIIYSRKHCPDIQAIPTIKHLARFSSYDLFDGQNGSKVLVMKLNAPSLVARHMQLMSQHGATYDYPVYAPHITLSDIYSRDTVAEIAPFEHDIILGEEYVEDLDLDWGK